MLRIYGIGFLFMMVLVMPHMIQSQDAVFSQFYANPLYLNPALAGAGDCPRLIANYRNQWPSMPGNFVTYSASFDWFSPALSGGLGAIATSDIQANSVYVTNRAALVYSYHLQVSRLSVLKAGFMAGMHHQRLNWDDLIFPDMIDVTTGNVNYTNSGEVRPENTSVTVPDFSAGFFYSYNNKIYGGVAAHHLSQPDLSLYASSVSSPLSLRLTAHAGGTIVLAERSIGHNSFTVNLSPNVIFQHQGVSNFINTGFYLERSPVIIGFWYRHAFVHPDAMIFLAGIKQKKFTFGYSFDFNTSKLRSASGGAHEVSVAMLIFCEKRTRAGAIKCPEF